MHARVKGRKENKTGRRYRGREFVYMEGESVAGYKEENKEGKRQKSRRKGCKRKDVYKENKDRIQ